MAVLLLELLPFSLLGDSGTPQLESGSPKPGAWLRRGYDAVLAKIIHTPHPAYLAVIIAVVVGLAMLPFLGQSLLPNFKENDLLIR